MKYPYFTYTLPNGDDITWVAESLSLNGCVGQGDTIEEAVKELESNEVEWIITAREVGIPIPPEEAKYYSGKIALRLEPAEHMKAAIRAQIEGISLNQYISNAVIAKNASK